MHGIGYHYAGRASASLYHPCSASELYCHSAATTDAALGQIEAAQRLSYMISAQVLQVRKLVLSADITQGMMPREQIANLSTAARAALNSPEVFRDKLAEQGPRLAQRPGHSSSSRYSRALYFTLNTSALHSWLLQLKVSLTALFWERVALDVYTKADCQTDCMLLSSGLTDEANRSLSELAKMIGPWHSLRPVRADRGHDKSTKDEST